jgi:hypothetical protein
MLADQATERQERCSLITAQPLHETDTWRILLLARGGSELLLLKRPMGLCLPALHIPRHERIAESLNAEAGRTWNLQTVCVAPFSVSHPDQASGFVNYHIMEVPGGEDLRRITPQTMTVAALKADAFADVRDYLAVRRAMKVDAADLPPDKTGPFSECGAFEQISAWVDEQLEPLGRKRDSAFHQLHANGFFALIRFATKDGAVWFKATGRPNQRELAITEHLAALFPALLPEIISVCNDWNAWLTDEVTGTSLDSRRDLDTWCRAASSLAELQVASVPHASSILSSGLHDARAEVLSPKTAPFFARIESLMDRQTRTVPRRLSALEIRSLGERLREALGRMESAAIPDALNHFDLNPANVIAGPHTCRFLDWAEAAVGNPFFSFEYLRQHFLRTFGGEPDAAATFRQSYANVWRKLLPDSTIALGMELMPLLAPFAYAVNTLPWSATHRDAQSESAGFLRSLARRMHREAELMIPGA